MKIYIVDGKACVSSGNGFTELLPVEVMELDAANEITAVEVVDHD